MNSLFETYAEALFGELPDAVLVHRDGAIVYANARMRRLLGCDSVDELRGRCVREFYSETEYPKVVGRVQAIALGRPLPRPQRHLLKRIDGGCVELEVSASRLRTPGGSLVVEIMRPMKPRGEQPKRLASDPDSE